MGGGGPGLMKKIVNRKISLDYPFKQTKPFSWLELLNTNSTVLYIKKTYSGKHLQMVCWGIVQAVGEATWQTVVGGILAPPPPRLLQGLSHEINL